jgi:excisionase family DNA binding protein
MRAKRAKSPLLTVPEAAKALGVSDQTVRRWIRTKRVPFTVNAQGWQLLRVEDVPAELLEQTKKLATRRYPKVSEPSEELRAEMVWLRTQLEKAFEIIAKLSEGKPDGATHDG